VGTCGQGPAPVECGAFTCVFMEVIHAVLAPGGARTPPTSECHNMASCTSIQPKAVKNVLEMQPSYVQVACAVTPADAVNYRILLGAHITSRWKSAMRVDPVAPVSQEVREFLQDVQWHATGSYTDTDEEALGSAPSLTLILTCQRSLRIDSDAPATFRYTAAVHSMSLASPAGWSVLPAALLAAVGPRMHDVLPWPAAAAEPHICLYA